MWLRPVLNSREFYVETPLLFGPWMARVQYSTHVEFYVETPLSGPWIVLRPGLKVLLPGLNCCVQDSKSLLWPSRAVSGVRNSGGMAESIVRGHLTYMYKYM